MSIFSELHDLQEAPEAALQPPCDFPRQATQAGQKDSAPPIVIVSVMRMEGETGMQTHFRVFLNALRTQNQPRALVTPFDPISWKALVMFGLRRPIQCLNRAAGVWWHRHWHEHYLVEELKYFFARNGKCVIYAQCPVSARAALLTRRSAEQRVVMAVHFNISQADEWAEKKMIPLGGKVYESICRLEKDVLPQLDGLVFVSDFMRRELQERIPAIKQVPSTVIPNFVVDPCVEKSDEYEADLISIGSLEPRKNQRYLLDIISAAKRQGSALRLTVVGDGPDRAMLEAYARQLKISDSVRFKGFVRGASDLLKRHKAYIHSAKMENMPLTLIEAMSYGLPVFSPAVGGIPEIFSDGVEGRMLPLDDADAAAARIIQWLNDPDKMSSAANSARKSYREKFESNVVSARLTKFLREVSIQSALTGKA
ncbi:glycosyltransferase [Oxalobacteraceae bacterium R-40]|uniref:Glycosyltransferase n=1 Tax=Keguizhuia sedimenti TaxID=3064264 RepID=A0ABU1BL37_9BURK|nr:glycosyltransferase [Oxalobacteraceae bacterium R-40]